MNRSCVQSRAGARSLIVSRASRASAALLIAWLIAPLNASCGSDDPCDVASLQAALDAAGSGETVTIAGGCRIEGGVTVPAGVTLRGAGSTIAVSEPGVVAVELGDGARLEEVALEAGGRAAVVARSDASLAQVTVALRRGIGIYLANGTASLDMVSVQGPVGPSNVDEARWIDVLAEPPPMAACPTPPCACEPGTVDAAGERVCDESGVFRTWAPTIGLYARDATVTLTDVSVAGIPRYGVVTDGSAIDWTAGSVSEVIGVGLLLRGGSSRLEDLEVSDVVAGLRGVPSYGVMAVEGHAQTTTGLTIRDGERFGLLALGATGEHTDLAIRDNGDVGIWVAESTAFEARGASVVERNGLGGVVVVDSQNVLLEGLRVAETRTVSRSLGMFGLQTIGDGIQLSGANDAIVLRDVRIEANDRVGLLVDVVPGLTFERVEVDAAGAAFGALGGSLSAATGAIVVDMPVDWDMGITRSGAAVANDPTALGAFDAVVEASPQGADGLAGIVGPMY